MLRSVEQHCTEERPLMTSLPDATDGVEALGVLSRFRVEFYDGP